MAEQIHTYIHIYGRININNFKIQTSRFKGNENGAVNQTIPMCSSEHIHDQLITRKCSTMLVRLAVPSRWPFSTT